MALDDWPEEDRKWAARYIWCLGIKQDVTLEASEARQAELIDARKAAGAPAAELFGDPDEVAAADGPELRGTAATVPVAVGGSGVHDALATGGAALLFVGVIAAIMVFVDGRTAVDVAVGPVALVLSIAAALIFGCAAMTQFSAGRMKAAARLGAVAGFAVLLGGSQVTWPGRDVVLLAGVPRWSVAMALLIPGLVAILISRAVPKKDVREAWSDEEWFARFRGVLVSKGVAADVAREHERSLRNGLSASAFDEYGRPDAFALRLAADDPGAPSRRLWWGAAGWLAFAVLQASFIPGETGVFLVLRVALTAGLLALACRSALRAWRSRPSARTARA